MATLHPFMGYRPTKELCSRVAALPYDVMSSHEAREMVKDNPLSFLHVDRAEIDLPIGVDIYSTQVYQRAADNLNKLLSDGTYVQDSAPTLYIYSLTMDGRSQRGIVGCCAVDEYLNDTIKKHELTRADKEQDRINHVDYCNANTGPIFLTYRHRAEIDAIVDTITAGTPVYDFVSEDGVGHQVWLVTPEYVDRLVELFKDVDKLYIADGHHRSASAVKVGLKRRQENPGYKGNEEFNYFLSVLFPDKELHIMDYNRVLKDLNGMTQDEFMDRLRDMFELTPREEAVQPQETHTFGMYIDKKWYLLKAKDSIIQGDEVEQLDVSILQNHVFAPLLNIGDPRTDKRIDFVGGIRGLGELERRVDSGEMTLAFSMCPTSVEELMTIADKGKIMPPKSTWFEPKLRSGIFIHRL